MTIVALDTETHLISPNNQAPRLVSVAIKGAGKAQLFARKAGLAQVRKLLRERATTIVGANIAFDTCVLGAADAALIPLLFDAYDADRIVDVQLQEKLITIRQGSLKYTKVSLGDLAERYLDESLDKSADGWRLRYSELDGVPIHEWPAAAIKYAKDDARATRAVYFAQRRDFEGYPHRAELARQTRAAFAMRLMQNWGINANAESVAALRAETEAEVEQFSKQLHKAGLLRLEERYPKGVLKRDGGKKVVVETRSMKAIEARVKAAPAYKKSGAPSTATGRASTSMATLRDSGDPVLENMAKRAKSAKVLDFVRVLEKATEHPFHPRWNVLQETGRSSCGSKEDPGNLQAQPRKGGIRQCWEPSPGHIFLTTDVDCAELRSWSQVTYSLFGFSAMRDVFLQGEGRDDPHMALHLAFPAVVPDRQFAKIPNFGFPGGLGAKKFVDYAKNYGKRVSLDQAYELRAAWQAQWPEHQPYFDHISDLTSDFSDHELTQLFSGRIRGQVRFTQAANSYFQGLTADMMLDAFYRIQRACYARPGSALYGCRAVAFVHDEIMLEVPYENRRDDRPHRAALEVQKHISDAAAIWTPDVPNRSSSAAMRRWYKGAKAKYTKQGLLRPWAPERDAE
ncbi:MAG: hypothetical protein E6Q97_00355 [Desulfurellales bacterium]|nr:MAG: hypothetical protein E6Q97_00355 [Desulfurellales bacterium]